MDETTPVAVEKTNNTLGIVSLVIGILGVLFVCCPYGGIILGIAALICGILARQQQQQFALAGIILGAVAILLGATLALVGRIFLPEFFDLFLRDFYF